MPRGKAEFSTMEPINIGNKSSLKAKESVSINKDVTDDEPTRNLLETKGLVHHMTIPKRFLDKGFVRNAIDEAKASKRK